MVHFVVISKASSCAGVSSENLSDNKQNNTGAKALFRFCSREDANKGTEAIKM